MPTPVRKQYLDIKAAYPGALVLFRMGDFYETFDDDARIAARDLEIVLTKRDMGQGEVVPLAGIPYHALDGYLARLIKKGHRVAICEQTSQPTGRTLVDREVVRVVTPGTVVEPALLDQAANNYLVAVAPGFGRAGIAHVDVTTGEFAATEVDAAFVPRELARLAPAEVLVPSPNGEALRLTDGGGTEYSRTMLDAAAFVPRTARRLLLDHFGVASLNAYGCEGLDLATAAAGAVVGYLRETHRAVLGQLMGLRTYSADAFMVLDPQTRRNLDLFEAGRLGERQGSLLAVLDDTKTPMGARLMRRWIAEPLLDLNELDRRHDAVGWFKDGTVPRSRVQALLDEIRDMERALTRIGAGMALPREVVALRYSLEQVPALVVQIREGGAPLAWLGAGLRPCGDAVALIAEALADDPQGEVGQGGVVQGGFSRELDELRLASADARNYIAGLERSERVRTGIPTLKVGYNKVFGYYLEVSNTHAERVPDDYVRRQTLTGGERFITPELKEYESRVLNARERMEELESALYRQVCRQVGEMAADIVATARAIAEVDVVVALGEAAARYGYVRPALDVDSVIDVVDGRHPMVERMLPAGSFVPNDLRLSGADAQLVVLTGPNMAGKSTYLRQAALITLMAQMGSFVPAKSARIGLVDRIFTRVGLQDDQGAGQSTFMVEMIETASILLHATPRSLVVLDEVGRGTSTYDGMSIAQAVLEHIHNAPALGCRTLFATHYHELTALASRLPRVRNYNVAVADEGGDIAFLHRIVPGGADRSYGVHVAQLAGLPRPVVRRAWELLGEHEQEQKEAVANSGAKPGAASPSAQLALFGAPIAEPSPALEVLAALDLDDLTPIEALNKLFELRRLAEGTKGDGDGNLGATP